MLKSCFISCLLFSPWSASATPGELLSQSETSNVQRLWWLTQEDESAEAEIYRMLCTRTREGSDVSAAMVLLEATYPREAWMDQMYAFWRRAAADEECEVGRQSVIDYLTGERDDGDSLPLPEEWPTGFVEDIVATRDDASPSLRWAVLWFVYHYYVPDYRPYVLDGLQDLDEGVREEAVRIISEFPDGEALLEAYVSEHEADPALAITLRDAVYELETDHGHPHDPRWDPPPRPEPLRPTEWSSLDVPEDVRFWLRQFSEIQFHEEDAFYERLEGEVPSDQHDGLLAAIWDGADGLLEEGRIRRAVLGYYTVAHPTAPLPPELSTLFREAANDDNDELIVIVLNAFEMRDPETYLQIILELPHNSDRDVQRLGINIISNLEDGETLLETLLPELQANPDIDPSVIQEGEQRLRQLRRYREVEQQQQQ